MGITAKRKPNEEPDIVKIATNANIKPIKKVPKASVIANIGIIPTENAATSPVAKRPSRKATPIRVKVNDNTWDKHDMIELEDLTPVQLNAIVSNAFNNAAEEAMQVMGYIMIAEDGWVIKLFADGTKEKIKELEVVPRPETIIL